MSSKPQPMAGSAESLTRKPLDTDFNKVYYIQKLNLGWTNHGLTNQAKWWVKHGEAFNMETQPNMIEV